MILVITSKHHRYTHQSLYRESGLDLEVATYDEILRRRTPHRATHIFTDLDRLSPAEVHEAAILYRSLNPAGITALNDPARFLGRFGMLRNLNRAGINIFDVYRADSLERPRKWPVFLRLEGNHATPVSGLLHSSEELDEALRQSLDQGVPRSALLIIEYAAEAMSPGVFRKLSVFRVGSRLLGYTCVHEDTWLVKYGRVGLATTEMYDEEYQLVRDNPYAAAVMPAFDAAGIEYGRVDFGLVAGKPQIYEINNNPHISLRSKSASDRRNESTALFRATYLQALDEIDSFRRPAWRRRPAALVRSVKHSPSRIRHHAAKVLGKVRRMTLPASGSPLENPSTDPA